MCPRNWLISITEAKQGRCRERINRIQTPAALGGDSFNIAVSLESIVKEIDDVFLL